MLPVKVSFKKPSRSGLTGGSPLVIPGNLPDREFILEAIKNPLVVRVAQKVNPHVLPEFTSREIEPARVGIKTKKGEVYVKQVVYPKGNPRNQMTAEDLANKFGDCALHGRRLLTRQVGKIFQLLG